MYNKIQYFLFVVIFLLNSNLYSQVNYCPDYPQTYTICNDTLNINVSTNKFSITEFDTLKINFDVSNVSPKTIGLFLRPIWEFYYDNDSTAFRIIINYVTNFTPDLETEMPFITLGKQMSKSFKYQLLPRKYSFSRVENIQIVFGVSYLPDIKKVDFKETNQETISVNNIQILEFLRDFSSKTLNVEIKK